MSQDRALYLDGLAMICKSLTDEELAARIDQLEEIMPWATHDRNNSSGDRFRAELDAAYAEIERRKI